jgi:hypothetical protein
MTAKFKSYNEFKGDYEKRGFIDKVSNRYYPRKPLNEKQIQRYYLQYVKKRGRTPGNGRMKIAGEQSEDSKLSAFARERDGGCRLLKVLSSEELSEWQKNQNGLGGILDAAHVFGKSAFPWMRFDERNVVTLNRFSHSCLDNGKSPINGKQITGGQRKDWWQRISGNDWRYLESRALRGGRDEPVSWILRESPFDAFKGPPIRIEFDFACPVCGYIEPPLITPPEPYCARCGTRLRYPD